MFRTQQATPPHSPQTLSIALGQATSGSTSAQFESPLSPSLGGSQDDLSARCRALARSVGSVAKEELWHAEHAQAQLSPRLASNVLSPLSPSAAFASPLSPRSMGPPTPDGSCFSLEEIEEEREDDTLELESDAAEGSAGTRSGAGTASASALTLTDDEGSDAESIRRGRRRDSGHGSLQLSGLRSPVRAALNQGATSLTVDVWLADGELLVGPRLDRLSPDETLASQYLDPLLQLFNPADYSSPSRSHRRRSSSNVLHITSSQPFHLFLRLRTDPSMTFQFLLHALAPLHDASLLSSFCSKSNLATPSLITVVCTGAAAPLDDIVALSPRYVFADAPIADDFAHTVREVTPVVSGSLLETTDWDGSNSATEEQLARIRAQVTKAHDAGLLIRYTNLPSHTHELVKATLRDVGVDFL